MVETYESYDLPDFNDPDIPLKEVLEIFFLKKAGMQFL
jgi:hypothetical protein